MFLEARMDFVLYDVIYLVSVVLYCFNGIVMVFFP
jgi:hypothetical protein